MPASESGATHFKSGTTMDPRRDNPAERGLTRVAVYERSIRASEERVWENVRDWEHLPWLHAGSFSSIDLVEGGHWGWRARIGLHPASALREILLELVIEPDEPRYVSRTLAGGGAGTEIWTRVEPRGAHETAVNVEFWLADVAPGSHAALGRIFTTLYTQLWNEDEEMMIVRERELRARAARSAAAAEPVREPLVLGTLDELSAKLPLVVEFGGQRFRILQHAGKLIAHSVVCPHSLGPLAEAPVEAGRIACPWHGYTFDVETGRECTGRSLRLAAAPEVRVDAASSRVTLG